MKASSVQLPLSINHVLSVTKVIFTKVFSQPVLLFTPAAIYWLVWYIDFVQFKTSFITQMSSKLLVLWLSAFIILWLCEYCSQSSVFVSISIFNNIFWFPWRLSLVFFSFALYLHSIFAFAGQAFIFHPEHSVPFCYQRPPSWDLLATCYLTMYFVSSNHLNISKIIQHSMIKTDNETRDTAASLLKSAIKIS